MLRLAQHDKNTNPDIVHSRISKTTLVTIKPLEKLTAFTATL
jgi:hypothetical protein